MSRLQSIQTCAKWLFSGLCCLELVVAFCSAALVLLSLQTVCSADVTLAWDASCEPNLDGYRIYYRQKSESYNYDHPDWAGNHTETTCTLYGPGDNTVYCFVARAVDVEGNESGDSNEVCYGPVVAPSKVIIYTENVSSTTGGSTDHDGTHSDTHEIVTT